MPKFNPISRGSERNQLLVLSLVVGIVVGLAAVLLCLAVFGLYTAPDFMVMLADQMWSCF